MTTPIDAELLPCPFCGAAASGYEIEPHMHSGPLKAIGIPDHGGSYVVEGDCACGSGLIGATQAEVIARWNRRAPQAGAGGEPVEAQQRFRHPQKTMPNWSPWQKTPIADRPSYEVDSQGYEVEYRLLCTAPPPQAVREPQPMPDLTQLTERGAKAWAGVDAQALREGLETTPEAMWDAFVEAWRVNVGVDKIVNIMGGEEKLKAVFLQAAGGITKGGQHGPA